MNTWKREWIVVILTMDECSFKILGDVDDIHVVDIFGELDYINKLRNRIAHHEPICFSKNPVSIDTQYIHNRYNRIMELFRWMGIDGASLLYGLGHIDNACNQIDALLK